MEPLAKPGALPCFDCPLTMLNAYLLSPPGQRIATVVDLDFALQLGIHVTLKDLSFPQFLILRVLAEERNKHTAEEMKKRG